jgi:hypothetical protein
LPPPSPLLHAAMPSAAQTAAMSPDRSVRCLVVNWLGSGRIRLASLAWFDVSTARR